MVTGQFYHFVSANRPAPGGGWLSSVDGQKTLFLRGLVGIGSGFVRELERGVCEYVSMSE
jgi:hypothetical protein